jgi:hypothetical protein
MPFEPNNDAWMKIFLTERRGTDQICVLVAHFHTKHKIYIRQLHRLVDKSFTLQTIPVFERKKLFWRSAHRFNEMSLKFYRKFEMLTKEKACLYVKQSVEEMLNYYEGKELFKSFKMAHSVSYISHVSHITRRKLTK